MFYVPVLKSQKTGGVRRSCQKRGKRLNCHDTGVAKAMKHGMPAAVTLVIIAQHFQNSENILFPDYF